MVLVVAADEVFGFELAERFLVPLVHGGSTRLSMMILEMFGGNLLPVIP
jgi:hypothetical protein